MKTILTTAILATVVALWLLLTGRIGVYACQGILAVFYLGGYAVWLLIPEEPSE